MLHDGTEDGMDFQEDRVELTDPYFPSPLLRGISVPSS